MEALGVDRHQCATSISDDAKAHLMMHVIHE